MSFTPETDPLDRTAKTWLERAANPGSADLRKNILRMWTVANQLIPCIKELPMLPNDVNAKAQFFKHGKIITLLTSVDQTIQKIRDKQLDPFKVANIMVEYMKENNYNLPKYATFEATSETSTNSAKTTSTTTT